MIRWEEDGRVLPAQIWCFIDFTMLKQGAIYDPGVYAVVESAEPNTKACEQNRSELFHPIVKEMDGPRRKFYVVSVDSFVSPACVIPDIGNTNNAAFLRLLPKTEWGDSFQTFLSTE